MVKYRVLKPFIDKLTGETYAVEQVIDMAVKRADEAINTLKKYDGKFLERVTEVELTKEEIEEEGL